MKKENYTIIFKKIETEDNIALYIPIDIMNGLVNSNGEFISKKNNIFMHIVNNPNDYGYAYNGVIDDLMSKYKYIPFSVKKKMIIKHMQKCNYIFGYSRENNMPMIIVQAIGEDNFSFLEDEYIEKYVKPCYKENKIKFDISNIYNHIKKNINNEEENIKRILTIIWKSGNNFLSKNEKNILISGNDLNTKKQIFTSLEEATNIPVTITSITDKNGSKLCIKEIEKLLEEILIKTNGNYNEAINSILVIDDFEKIKFDINCNYSVIENIQFKLIELLNGQNYMIDYNNQKILFDTSKLIIVCLGRLDQYKPTANIGFVQNKDESSNYKRELYINNGISEELCNCFQTIININKTDIKNTKISEDNNVIEVIENLLKSEGIELELTDDVWKILSKTESPNDEVNYTQIEETNKLFTPALFEIASNPNMYEKLIITEETIKDNRSYKLVKKNRKK